MGLELTTPYESWQITVTANVAMDIITCYQEFNLAWQVNAERTFTSQVSTNDPWLLQHTKTLGIIGAPNFWNSTGQVGQTNSDGTVAAWTTIRARQIKIKNKDSGTTQTVILQRLTQYPDGSSPKTLDEYPSATLLPGESLVYDEATGFNIITSAGLIKVGSGKGCLLNVQIIDTGTSYAPTNGTNSARVRGWGAGGGGGGVTSGGGGTGTVGGGGQAGSYVEKWYTSMSSPSLTIGTAGTAGTNSGGNGGDGGDSTFTMGGVTITAKGGKGGTGDASAAANAITAGGSGNSSSSGDVNGSGMPGGSGFVLSAAAIGSSGVGGSCEVGAGGVAQTAEGAGNAGVGHASGGSGGLSLSGGSAHTGGAGTKGLFIIEEYS